MKLLLILLACIAVTNASTVVYSYSYFCHMNYCVFPSNQLYHYRIRFNPYWCSSKFYSPILKMYPGEDCGTEGWKETPIAETVDEMRNLLKESLLKVAREMNSQRDAWTKQVDQRHKDYKETFALYVNKYYAYKMTFATDAEKAELAKERDAKIAEYNAKLDERRTDALKAFSEAVLAKLQSVIAFHEKLVENAAKCLATRAAKILDYEKEINKKIKDYTINYYKYLLAILKTRSQKYKEILVKLDCNPDSDTSIVDRVIVVFAKHEMFKIRDMVAAYTKQMLVAKDTLLGFYTCAYRCYLSNSYLKFYRAYYYNGCQKLGRWYQHSSYKYVNYSMGKFSFNWRKITYNGLKTCDLNTLNKPVADVKSELQKKLDEAVAKFVVDFAAWKAKWVQYHVEYYNKYKEIVKARHAFVIDSKVKTFQAWNKSLELTADQKAQIADCTKELAELYNKTVADYQEKLAQIIVDCASKFSASIERFRQHVQSYLDRVVASYASCLTDRAARIADYKKKLDVQHASQRSAMIASMSAAKLSHFKNYIAMLTAYHGENLPEEVMELVQAYAEKLVIYCKSVTSGLDSYWTDASAKLVLHYSCTARCRQAQFYMPTYRFGSYYTWKACYPQQSSYGYYYNAYYSSCFSS